MVIPWNTIQLDIIARFLVRGQQHICTEANVRGCTCHIVE